MRLITQIWSTQLGRYVEDELSLCECLPAVVREGLEVRGLVQPSLFGENWDDLELSA